MTPHEQATTAASGAVQNAGFNPATSRDIAIIAIAAYLRARKEIDGAVLCVVPDKRPDNHFLTYDGGRYDGWNACRAAVLASVENPDADV